MQLSVAILIGVLASYAVTAWRASRLPPFPGRTEYFLLTAAGGWWAATAFFDLMSKEIEVKLFFSELAWFGIVTAPLFWMQFIRAYLRGSDSPNSALYTIVSFGGGLAALIVALTNQFHHMVYTGVHFAVGTAYPDQVVYDHGIAYYILAAVIYAMMLITVVETLTAAIRASSHQRMQLVFLLITALVPWAANAAYLFGGLTVLGYDPTPLAFWILPITYNFTVSRRRTYSVAPIALSAVFKAHPDVVVVVGIDGRVIMHNPAAERLFELESDITGAPFDQLVARFDHGGDSTEPDGDLWRLDGRWYELRCVPVVEGRAEQARAYVWREVTAFIETQQELRVAAKLMEERLDANLRLHEQLREMALRDSLTGLHNRRILEDVGDRLIANADATQMPLSVVSLDLDHFKQLNDTHGHKAGDDALVLVSSILNRSLRPNEVAIRMGGEEFLVLMPDVDAETAVARAEAWQTLLASMPVPTPRGETVVHFSAGVATYPTHASTFAALLQKVDRAVYSAKNAGRDRVVISRPKQVRVA